MLFNAVVGLRQVVALGMQVEGRARMRLALQRTIAERERRITEIGGSGQPLQLPRLQVLPALMPLSTAGTIVEARAEVEVMSLEAARQEAAVARLERGLAEAVVPLVVTEEEQLVRAFIIASVHMEDPYRSRWSSASPRSRQQHAVAEATEEIIA